MNGHLLFCIQMNNRNANDFIESNSPPITGAAFMLAFRTVLICEQIAAKIGRPAWAKAAGVDRRSLERFAENRRDVSCVYAWRLCESLGLRFGVVVEKAVGILFQQENHERLTWKPSLLPKASSTVFEVSEKTARRFSKRLCLLLADKLDGGGLSQSEVARRSGVDRTALSRLRDPSRQNLTLPVLFDVALALGEPLDTLARTAAKACQARC